MVRYSSLTCPGSSTQLKSALLDMGAAWVKGLASSVPARRSGAIWSITRA
jgi:hypothetical protein